jgi:hypothetical protein
MPATELRVTVSDEVAERLACAAAERGTSTEDLAAEFEAPDATTVAEAERQLEDGEDNGFPR